MKKKELLKQLNKLKTQIKPDQIWQKTNREILLNQIKAQTGSDFALQFNNKVLIKNMILSAYKPVVSFIVVFLVVFGAYIASVSATKNSLPGDLLYNVKLTTERMQVNLTLNDEKRTNLEIEFAGRRLNEIKKVIENHDPANKKEDLNVPLKKFQESMVNVKSNLAKLEVANKETALKVADLIDEKTKEYVGLLEDQQKELPNLALNTEKAISASKTTGDKALSLIIKEFELGQGTLSVDEVKSKIQGRIDSLEKNIVTAKADIEKIINNKKIAEEQAKIAAEEAAKKAVEEAAKLAEEAAQKAAEEEAEKAAKEQVLITNEEVSGEEIKKENNEQSDGAENTEITTENKTAEDQEVETEPVPEPKEPEEILPSIEEIKAKPDQAQVFLDKAKDFLKGASVSQAFDQVRQANEIMILINKVIKANEQYLIDSIIEENTEGAEIKNDPAEIKDETVGEN